ncbi:hypothetical protein, partial [Paenibacillus gorillae]|uniref:hypothetical protein n=1 Tax=Paenibacillus gorillae TaxID=1243662 RepID=UPI001EE34277
MAGSGSQKNKNVKWLCPVNLEFYATSITLEISNVGAGKQRKMRSTLEVSNVEAGKQRKMYPTLEISNVEAG